jgi:hypothetical protein
MVTEQSRTDRYEGDDFSDEAALKALRQMAEDVFGVTFSGAVRSGTDRNFLGIRGDNLLVSRRLDSRTGPACRRVNPYPGRWLRRTGTENVSFCSSPIPAAASLRLREPILRIDRETGHSNASRKFSLLHSDTKAGRLTRAK